MDDVEIEGLELFHKMAADTLNDLRKCFTADVKLTLLVRAPEDEDAEVCITDDNLDDIEALIARMKARKFG